MRTLLICAVIAVGAWVLWPSQFHSRGPGVLAPETPVQRDVSDSVAHLERGEYDIAPLASFNGKARVLSREDYWVGRETDLSPTDLVLGWGPMSDESVLAQISISQSNRFYFWRVQSFPIPRRDIERNSANMHFIPADDGVAETLGDVDPGDVIRFDGYLVEVHAQDGWHWRSSLTRDDTGNHACEVIWLRKLQIL